MQSIYFKMLTSGYHGVNENPTYATDSAAAIIMMVFQYIDNGGKSIDMLEQILARTALQ